MTVRRVAIAGFQHETNCFGVTKADLAEFEMADSWPEMLIGARVLSETRGMNLPIAGFAEAATEAGFEPVPLLWCAAEPSAHVTDRAFETITGMILRGIREAGRLDAVYLDLHGAMVTEHFADGEGEILRRVREVVGSDIPIVASLDLHANISPQMVDQTDFLTMFRSYPHLDMAQTGARCVAVLERLMRGERFSKAFRQIPYLIPLHAQFTGQAPFDDLYGFLPQLLNDRQIHAEIALGFTAADFPNTGPSCVAYAWSQLEANDGADEILTRFLDIEPQIDHSMLSLPQAVHVAGIKRDKPLILADVQDNPGAGGTSDTTGLLRAFIDAECKNILMGLLHDPETAAQAHAAGPRASFLARLGGKSGLPGVSPVECEVEILALSDGACRYSGEMYGGGIAALGQSAALRLVGVNADIDLVVTSLRNQCLDLAHFTHFGLDPRRYNTVCVKSTVHFRAAFDPIAQDVKSVASPGVFICRLDDIPYQNLHNSKRRHPLRQA